MFNVVDNVEHNNKLLKIYIYFRFFPKKFVKFGCMLSNTKSKTNKIDFLTFFFGYLTMSTV